jgi:hypothetical protein
VAAAFIYQALTHSARTDPLFRCALFMAGAYIDEHLFVKEAGDLCASRTSLDLLRPRARHLSCLPSRLWRRRRQDIFSCCFSAQGRGGGLIHCTYALARSCFEINRTLDRLCTSRTWLLGIVQSRRDFPSSSRKGRTFSEPAEWREVL